MINLIMTLLPINTSLRGLSLIYNLNSSKEKGLYVLNVFIAHKMQDSTERKEKKVFPEDINFSNERRERKNIKTNPSKNAVLLL